MQAAFGTVLWVVALLSLLIVIVASLTNFHSHLAFTYPHKAFAFGGPFWAGLGGGLLIGNRHMDDPCIDTLRYLNRVK